MITKKERLEQLFAGLDEKGWVNGAILAAENGEIVYKAAFGYADMDTGRRLTPDSVFELASVSKPFTAMGIILLEEQGKLSYDDPVEKWLPRLPYPGITVRHLLQHTSGLPDYLELFFTYWDRTAIATNADVLELLQTYQPPAYFAPNDKWLYSNTGYVLLAVIIEQITGLSFAKYMRDHIFQPLGMENSFIYNRRYAGEQIPDYAYGYVYDFYSGSYRLPDAVADTSYVAFLDGIQGDGTVNATLNDIFKFDQALYTSRLASKASLDKAFSPAKLNDGSTFDYGFGWIIGTEEHVGGYVTHSGGWPGYATNLIRYTDHNKTIILLINAEQDNEFLQQIAATVENILFDQPYTAPVLPPQRAIVKVSSSAYDRLTGTYLLGAEGETAAEVLLEDGRLYLQLTGQLRVELFPASETVYFIRALPIEVTFSFEGEVKADSKADRLTILQDGSEEHAVRVK